MFIPKIFKLLVILFLIKLFARKDIFKLLIDIDILLIVEKRIRGGISHAIHRNTKGKNRYMKNYNKDSESLYVQYLDANNLYG